MITPERLVAAADQADLTVLQTTPLDRWQCPDLDWQAITAMIAGLPLDRLFWPGRTARSNRT